MKNLEIRGGMSYDVTDPVLGEFKGPGTSKGVHLIPFEKPSEVLFLKFQLKLSDAHLQINGIQLQIGKGKIYWSCHFL